MDGTARLVANKMQMLLAAALAGVGVAYGPPLVFGESIARGALRLLGHKASELAIHAVYPTKRHVSLKLRRLIEHVSTSSGDVLPWDLMLRPITGEWLIVIRLHDVSFWGRVLSDW